MSSASRTSLHRGVAQAAIVLFGAVAVPYTATAAPRITPLAQADWDQTQRAIVAERASGGRATNLSSTYLHHPQLAASLLPFEQYIASDSVLPARHRALLGLRTAWLMGSEYLWA